MKRTADEAIILLGHGSRVSGAAEDMNRVAARLKDKYGYARVETCSMSRLGPRFPEIFERCVAGGAKKVVVVPYFLHSGLHLVLDIPQMLQEKAREFPGVEIVFGKNLGFDEALVDLVEKRIRESIGLPDVRNLRLKGRAHYPLPPGEMEFVPLPPELAARYNPEDPHN